MGGGITTLRRRSFPIVEPATHQGSGHHTAKNLEIAGRMYTNVDVSRRFLDPQRRERMVRWACFPILALLLGGCAFAPAEKHPALDNQPANAPAQALTELPAQGYAMPQASVAAPAPEKRPRTSVPAAVSPASTRRRGSPQPVPRPIEAAVSNPAVGLKVTASVRQRDIRGSSNASGPTSTPPISACPELAVSSCFGRAKLPSIAALVKMPLEKLQSLRRCELDIDMKAPALFGIEPARSTRLFDALRDHCSQDYASIRVLIDARLRLGR